MLEGNVAVCCNPCSDLCQLNASCCALSPSGRVPEVWQRAMRRRRRRRKQPRESQQVPPRPEAILKMELPVLQARPCTNRCRCCHRSRYPMATRPPIMRLWTEPQSLCKRTCRRWKGVAPRLWLHTLGTSNKYKYMKICCH